MSTVRYLLVAASINACWIVPAYAGENHLDVKTGLWEINTSGQASGSLPIPAEMLDKLTPERRARFEQMMEMSKADAAQSRKYKECVTEEQMDRGFTLNDENESCKKTIISNTAKVMEIREECQDGKRGSGTIRFEAVSDEEVKGNVHMTVGGGDGMTIDKTIEAKWLGSDYGDIEPGDMVEE